MRASFPLNEGNQALLIFLSHGSKPRKSNRIKFRNWNHAYWKRRDSTIKELYWKYSKETSREIRKKRQRNIKNGIRSQTLDSQYRATAKREKFYSWSAGSDQLFKAFTNIENTLRLIGKQ